MRVLFFLVSSLVLITCSTPQVKLDDKNTSITSKLQQDKLRESDDYSWLKNKKIPTPKELGNNELDIRSVDCSKCDLSKYNPEKITFDADTIFPKNLKKMPARFNKDLISNNYKNPGLNVYKLHKMGIDGTGMSIAIIDQTLSPHIEYTDNIVWYKEILSPNLKDSKSQPGSMHGSAVSSIAVGKTVGVVPKAKLYYFAADLIDDPKYFTTPKMTREEKTNFRTSKYYAQALYEIIDINKKLPDNEKIVVVSVSAAPDWSKDPQLWNQALEKAKKEGIFVTTTNLETEYNLFDHGTDRSIFKDPDNPNSYTHTSWDVTKDINIQKKTLCFPMDHRTVAAPTGNNKYVHYASGGWSWMKPFEAGMYVLAKQVKKDITPQEFFDVGLNTGTYSKKTRCVLVNPVALINALKKDKVEKK